MKESMLKTSFCATVLLAWATFAGSLAAQSAPPIPQLVHTGFRYQLLVNGKPFLMLGGQAHNSSASNPKDLEPVWRSLVAMHANTAEVPLYWELVEPQPGHFDFHLIDSIIEGARQHGLHLVLLWFGTWKNGAMTYTPPWIKTDPAKYFRVRNEAGQPIDVISPLCAAAREADEKAFAAVMQHIKSVDESERTVIMMQVENETGLLGTDRDYSPQANTEYESQVPATLMTYLEAHRGHLMPALESAWASKHFARSGKWQDVFGDLAPEAFSAWYVARYVNAVAAAGKQQ
ncbi:MAG: beta-galactosidase, partial [Acidobacteriota bacterium]